MQTVADLPSKPSTVIEECTRLVVIGALGRSGTQWLGKTLGELVTGANSGHESDMIVLDRPSEWMTRVAKHGVGQSILSKLCSNSSPRVLGVKRQRKLISDDLALTHLSAWADMLLSGSRSTLHIEANSQLRALIDLVPKARPLAKSVYVVRDARDWVSSWMNKQVGFYSAFDFVSWLPYGRIKSFHIDHSGGRKSWSRMDRFERLCWTWAFETAYTLQIAHNSSECMVIRYEDMFTRPGLERLLAYVSNFADGKSLAWTFDDRVLHRRLNGTRVARFPSWQNWPPALARKLVRHCGTLMEQFDYGTEDDWRSKLGS